MVLEIAIKRTATRIVLIRVSIMVIDFFFLLATSIVTKTAMDNYGIAAPKGNKHRARDHKAPDE